MAKTCRKEAATPCELFETTERLKKMESLTGRLVTTQKPGPTERESGCPDSWAIAGSSAEGSDGYFPRIGSDHRYISVRGFPWPRLRRELPDQYETYVDLAPGEWTKVKIVNDLKQGQSKGAIALWVGPGTIAHFANLRVSK